MTVLRRAAVAVGAALLGAGLLFPTAAVASKSQGFIAGTGVVTDDWGDEGVIDQNTSSFNNAVAVWQSVLFADGYLLVAGIDCDFGPATSAATANWQDDLGGLTIDGSAGPQTLGRADNFLSISGTRVIYHGLVRNVEFHRLSDGRYQLNLGNGPKTASYTSASACA
jgi:hypothetical protein